MAKPAAKAPADKLALYEALVARFPEVERKGAAMPYTSMNGNMFSQLDPTGTLALRLGEPERSAFLKAHDTKLHEAYGIVQKEYVDVPAQLLADTDALAKHFQASIAYVASLRAKPTTRKKT